MTTQNLPNSMTSHPVNRQDDAIDSGKRERIAMILQDGSVTRSACDGDRAPDPRGKTDEIGAVADILDQAMAELSQKSDFFAKKAEKIFSSGVSGDREGALSDGVPARDQTSSAGDDATDKNPGVTKSLAAMRADLALILERVSGLPAPTPVEEPGVLREVPEPPETPEAARSVAQFDKRLLSLEYRLDTLATSVSALTRQQRRLARAAVKRLPYSFREQADELLQTVKDDQRLVTRELVQPLEKQLADIRDSLVQAEPRGKQLITVLKGLGRQLDCNFGEPPVAQKAPPEPLEPPECGEEAPPSEPDSGDSATDGQGDDARAVAARDQVIKAEALTERVRSAIRQSTQIRSSFGRREQPVDAGDLASPIVQSPPSQENPTDAPVIPDPCVTEERASQSRDRKIDDLTPSVSPIDGVSVEKGASPQSVLARLDFGLSMSHMPDQAFPGDQERPLDLLSLARRSAQAISQVEEADGERAPAASSRACDRPGPSVGSHASLAAIIVLATLVAGWFVADRLGTLVRDRDNVANIPPTAGEEQVREDASPGAAAERYMETGPIVTGSLPMEADVSASTERTLAQVALATLPAAPDSRIAFARPDLAEASLYSFNGKAFAPSAGFAPLLANRIESDTQRPLDEDPDIQLDWSGLEPEPNLAIVQVQPGRQPHNIGYRAEQEPTIAEPKAEDDPRALQELGEETVRTQAEAGSEAAQFELADRIANGRTEALRAEDAVAWYKRSARSGFAPAQYVLASLYEAGNTVKRDPRMAVFWYQEAAENGHGEAMHNLAVLKASGVGGQPDFVEAAFWFERAAENDIRDSQFNLGILYSRGAGVPKDPAQAYKWFSIAAEAGDDEAEAQRRSLLGSLSAGQRQSVRRSVDAFQAGRSESSDVASERDRQSVDN